MVPKGWKFEILDKLVEEKKNSFCIGPFGSDLMLKDYRTQGTPIVFVRDIKRGRFEWISNVYIDPEKAEQLKAHSVQYSDIVITKMGLPPGIAAVYPYESPRGIVTADIIKMSPNQTLLDSYYGCTVLNSHFVSKQVAERTAGQTRPKLTLSDYKTIKILVPPLFEQKKITQILSTWDKAIITTERLLTNRQQQKKALMQRLLTGKQRFAGFEGEWKCGTLNDLATIDTGFAFKSVDFTDSTDSVPIIRMSDFKAGGLDLSSPARIPISLVTNMDRFALRDKDFVFGMSGSLSNYAWVKSKDLPCFLNQRVGRIAAKSDADQMFVTYLYLSEQVQQDIIDKAAGAAQLNISVGDLRNTKIKYPSIKEQQKIACVLSAADAEITTIQNQLDNLKQQKKALMQQLLTGKRRVKVDSPALATQ